MIIIDIISGTIDWIKIKFRHKSMTIFWLLHDTSWKTCVKTRIIERRLKKI